MADYSVRRHPAGGAIVVAPDGLTWATARVSLFEAGRAAFRLNGGLEEPLPPAEPASEARLIEIVDKMTGPDRITLERRGRSARRLTVRPFDWARE